MRPSGIGGMKKRILFLCHLLKRGLSIAWRSHRFIVLSPPSRCFSNSSESPDVPLNASLSSSDQERQRDCIRFDNYFRAGASLFSIALCFGLWWGNDIGTITKPIILFVIYVLFFLSVHYSLRKTNRLRLLSYVACGMDLLILSLALMVTGGHSSPLFFFFFLPLIVQAFHRDQALLLFNGFGGLAFYGGLSALAIMANGWNGPMMIEVGERLFFLTVAMVTAVIHVNSNLQHEIEEKGCHCRMQFITDYSSHLNRVNDSCEIPALMMDLVQNLNADHRPMADAWSRLFVLRPDGFMSAIDDPAHPKPALPRELSPRTCPAVTKNSSFVFRSAEKDAACPTASFSFKSHVCIPISSTDNESYGIIFSGSPRPDAFGDKEIEFLTHLAKSLGHTIQRLKKSEELGMAIELGSCAVASFIKSTRSSGETIDSILDGVISILEPDQVSFYLWDPGHRLFRPLSAKGPHADEELKLTCPVGEGVMGRVFEEGEPLYTSEFESDTVLQEFGSTCKSLLSIPLKTMGGESIGILNSWIFSRERTLSDREINRASTFAIRAAIALENALLHEKARFSNPSSSASVDIKKAA